MAANFFVKAILFFAGLGLWVQAEPIYSRSPDLKFDFIALSAAYFQGQSYLFYADQRGTVGYWESQTEIETPGGPLYKKHTIKIKGRQLTTRIEGGVPGVTSLIYGTQQTFQALRVYYIDPSGYIKEAARDNQGNFTTGALDALRLRAAPNSGLTAYFGPQIKVYFYAMDSPNIISVAWIDFNSSSSWSARQISHPLPVGE